MSFQIDKRMLQGWEQLDFSRAAADPAIYQSINRISTMVIPRARLLPESFLLGVVTIPRAHGLPGVKLLEANTFLEAFLPGNLLLLGAYGFLESTHPSQKKKRLITARWLNSWIRTCTSIDSRASMWIRRSSKLLLVGRTPDFTLDVYASCLSPLYQNPKLLQVRVLPSNCPFVLWYPHIVAPPRGCLFSDHHFQLNHVNETSKSNGHARTHIPTSSWRLDCVSASLIKLPHRLGFHTFE